MNGIVRNSAFPVNSLGKLRVRLYRGGLALLSVLCLLIIPTAANAACGRYGMPALKTSIKLPAAAIADSHLPGPWEIPTVVGLWHVIYTNGADQSTFNDTFDTWHIDGTEFESAFLAPAGGDVCVGVWRPLDARSVKLHHIGWLFDPANPTGTAINYFTLDEEVTVSEDNRSYNGSFTFKIWNLDGTPTPAIVTGTMAATRITVH